MSVSVEIEIGKQDVALERRRNWPAKIYDAMITVEDDTTRCYICSYGHCRRNCPIVRCKFCLRFGHNEKICPAKVKHRQNVEVSQLPRNNNRALLLLFSK